MNYTWECGDNSTEEGVTVSHVYTAENYQGYQVRLTVKNSKGAISQAAVRVPVWLAGDTNGDEEVNILDAAQLGLHWDTNYGTPVYDDGADLNNDDEINIVDAAIIGLNWGRTA